MRYRTPSAALFTAHRRNLAARLPHGALAIVHANDVMPTNADGTMRFKQNSDLFYLTGVDQAESVLLLFPDSANTNLREVLFTRFSSEQTIIWEGHKLSKEEATQISGIQRIEWLDQFEVLWREAMCEASSVFLSTNELVRAEVVVETRNRRFIAHCQQAFPLHQYGRLAPLMHGLRSIKSTEEVRFIREACAITKAGFERVLRFVRPGVMEYEVEAEYAHEFIRRGAGGFAYAPIIASGKNACVLHYGGNDQMCRDGDLLLMDVAAEYANYNSDLTRTIPVNGRFTERQRAVYNAVLRVFHAAHKLLRPGIVIKEYQEKVGEAMEAELLQLGLITQLDIDDQTTEKPAFKKYFMHGTSHLLGLDVHDVGMAHRPVQAGMVFTIEPGIYIPDEGFGIRLENDFWVEEETTTDLMADIPIEADEIERLMQA